MRLRALAQFLKSSLSIGQRQGSYKASFEFQNTNLNRIDYGLGLILSTKNFSHALVTTWTVRYSVTCLRRIKKCYKEKKLNAPK